MRPSRRMLWNLMVLGMIPFILGAGLPQLECRCAAAKGQRWCECCFRRTDESSLSKSSLKPCCQRRLKSEGTADDAAAAVKATSGCPTCHQFRNPKTGSCCSLKQADAPTLSELVVTPDLDSVLTWLPPLPIDLLAPVATNGLSQEDRRWIALSMCLDHVIVFERLLI